MTKAIITAMAQWGSQFTLKMLIECVVDSTMLVL